MMQTLGNNLKRKVVENISKTLNVTAVNLEKKTRKRSFDKIFCNYPNDKLSDTEWRKIEKRCHKGEYSESGFLKKDEFLREVIDNDTKYLKSVGVTHEQISGKLEELINKYQESQRKDDKPPGSKTHSREDKFVTIDNFKISSVQYRGYQDCPFKNKDFDKDPKSRGSCDYTITNIKTNESIKFGDLLIHLISRHHFFEGNVDYRLDPKIAINVLEITPTSTQA